MMIGIGIGVKFGSGGRPLPNGYADCVASAATCSGEASGNPACAALMVAPAATCAGTALAGALGLAACVGPAATCSAEGTVVDNASPTVAITSPAGGAELDVLVATTISGTMGDVDGTIASVEVFDGATSLGTATLGSGTWTFSWTPARTATGSHSLTAKATDDDGAVTTSAAVSVTVRSPATIADVMLWQSAADAADFTLIGSTVTQWNDVSGQGNHTTGVQTDAPTRQTDSTLGGAYVVTSGSGEKYLTGASAIATALSGSDKPFTLVQLMRLSLHETHDIWKLTGSGSTAHRIGHTAGARYSYVRNDGSTGATPTPADTDPSPDAEWRVVAVRFDGTTITTWTAGSVSSSLACDVGSATFTAVTEYYKYIAVRERALYSRALSDDECLALATGMRGRAGLTMLTGIMAIPGVEVYTDEAHGFTLSDSAANALASWTSTGLTSWSGTTITEDSGTSEHSIQGTSDCVAGPASLAVAITPSGRTDFRVALGTATCFFSLSGAGSVGTASGCTGTISKSGSEYTCTIEATAVAASAVPKVNAASDGSTVSYAGSGSAAGTISSATITQRTVSAWATRTLSGNNLTQGTRANQPFYRDGINGGWNATNGLQFKAAHILNQTTLFGMPATTIIRFYKTNTTVREYVAGQSGFLCHSDGNMQAVLGAGTESVGAYSAGWNTALVTLNGNTTLARINSTEKTCTTLSGSGSISRFGGYDTAPTQCLTGQLKRVVVFNRSLTSAEKTTALAEVNA